MQQRSHKQENSAIFWQCNLWNKYVYVISIDYFAFVDQYSWLLFIPSVYLFRICVVYVIFFDKHSTLKWLRVKECKIYFKKKKIFKYFVLIDKNINIYLNIRLLYHTHMLDIKIQIIMWAYWFQSYKKNSWWSFVDIKMPKKFLTKDFRTNRDLHSKVCVSN